MKENLSRFMSVRNLALFLALLYLATGVSVFDQYGISYDEEAQRLDNGLVNFRYIESGDEIPLIGGNEKYHGPAFEILLIYIEKAMNADDVQQIYLMRHLVNFLTFFLSAVVLFLLSRKLFQSDVWGLFSSLMYVLSPRFFAESFYNSKDVILLAFFVFSLYTLYRFSRKTNLKWAAIHAIVTAIAIDIRILGIVVPAATFGFLIYQQFFTERKIAMLKFISVVSTYLIVQFLMIVAFWPVLWEGPVEHLMAAFNEMSHYHWIGNIRYLGRIYAENRLPWHYLPTWMFITIPLPYQLTFLIGVVSILFKAMTLSKRVIEQYSFMLLLLGLFFLPLVLIIIRQSIVYDGWRHVYFLYAPFMLLATFGAKSLFELWTRSSTRKHSRLGLTACFMGVFAFPAYDTVSDHPHQFTYFNRAAKSIFHPMENHFEMDYWGLAYREGLEYLLNSEGGTIKLYCENAPGFYNRLLLSPIERERLQYMGGFHEAGIFYLADHREKALLEPTIPVPFEEIHRFNSSSGRMLTLYRATEPERVKDTIRLEFLSFDDQDRLPFRNNGENGVNKVGDDIQYGHCFTYHVDSLVLQGIPEIRIQGDFMCSEIGPNIGYVVAVDRKEHNVLWKVKRISDIFNNPIQWVEWSWTHRFDKDDLEIGDVIKVYAYSPERYVMFQDNLQAMFLTYSYR